MEIEAAQATAGATAGNGVSAKVATTGTSAGNSSDGASDAGAHNGASTVTDKIKKASDEAFKAGFARAAEKIRADVLGELGLADESALQSYRKWREDTDKQTPEIERIKKAWNQDRENHSKQLSEYRGKLENLSSALWATKLGNYGSSLMRAMDATDTVSDEEVTSYLEKRLRTEGEGADTRLVFADGDFTIDMDSGNALASIAQLVAKQRPHWVKSKIASGGAGTAHSSMPGRLPQKPQTVNTPKDFVKQYMTKRNGGI